MINDNNKKGSHVITRVTEYLVIGTAIVGLGIWAGKLDERTLDNARSIAAHEAKPAHFEAERRFGIMLTTLQSIAGRLGRIENKLDER